MFSYKALKPRTRLSSGRAGCAPLCGLPPTRTTYAKRRSGALSGHSNPEAARHAAARGCVVKTGQDARIERVARARGIDGLGTNGRKPAFLSAVPPHTALFAGRNTDGFLHKTFQFIGEGLHFVIGELHDVGKGNDLAADRGRLLCVPENIGAASAYFSPSA